MNDQRQPEEPKPTEEEPIEAEIPESRQSEDPEDPSGPGEIITVLEESMGLIEMGDTMEDRAKAWAVVMRHVLNVTFPTDWVIHQDQGGEGETAFLQGSGARRIAAFLGIGISNMGLEREDKTDSKGSFYQYVGKARFSWMGRVLEATGGASCRHSRLSRGGDIAPEDVDERNVRTFVQTSLTRIGVTNILGLGGYPVSELPEKTRSGQVFRDKVRRANFNKGTKGGSDASRDEKGLQEDIMRMASQMFGNDKEKASDWLEHMSSFPERKDGELTGKTVAGKRHVKYLRGRRLEFTHKDCKASYEEFQAGGE